MALVEMPVRPLPLRSGAAAFRLHLDGGRMLEIDPDFDRGRSGQDPDRAGATTMIAWPADLRVSSGHRRHRHAQVHRHPGHPGGRALGHWIRYPAICSVSATAKRDTIKILYWDRNGFCLWHKRLERDRFHWPESESEVRLIADQGVGLAARRPVARTGGAQGDPL